MRSSSPSSSSPSSSAVVSPRLTATAAASSMFPAVQNHHHHLSLPDQEDGGGMRSRNHSEQQFATTSSSSHQQPPSAPTAVPSVVVSSSTLYSYPATPEVKSTTTTSAGGTNPLMNLAVLPPAHQQHVLQQQQQQQQTTQKKKNDGNNNNDGNNSENDADDTNENEKQQMIPSTATAITSSSHHHQPHFDSQIPRAFFSFPPVPLSFFGVTKNLIPQFTAAFINVVLYFLGSNLIMASVGRHYDTLTLAAVGGALSLNNIFGYSFATGFCGALDTMCSASWGRLKSKAAQETGKKKNCAHHHQVSRDAIEEIGELTILAIGVVSVLLIPFTLLFWNSAPIVRLIFGEEYVALAAPYLQAAIPNLYFSTFANALVKSCQAQQRADIPAVATVLSTIASIITSMYVVPNFGVTGVAFSITMNSVVVVVAIPILTYLDGCFFERQKFVVAVATDHQDLEEDKKEGQKDQDTKTSNDNNESESNNQLDSSASLKPEVLLFRVNWLKPNLAKIFTYTRVIEFLRVGASCAAAVCAEWLSFEVWLLISSRLGKTGFASFSVMMSVTVMVFSLAASIGVAASSHVGSLLGENKPLAAFTHAKVTIMWAIMLAFCTCLVVRVFHEPIFSFYTNDPAVMDHLKNILVIFIVFVCLDHTQFTTQAALFRGTGKNEEAPKLSLGALWLIGLPCSYLGSLHYDLFGLLAGYIVGLGVLVPLLWRKANTFDWMELGQIASRSSSSTDNTTSSAEDKNSTKENVIVDDPGEEDEV